MRWIRSSVDRRSAAGFTLIEVIMSGSVLVISAVALAATLAQSNGLTQAPREEILARNAIRSTVAALAATPFDQVAGLFHGQGFPVAGLPVAPGDPDGMCGDVTFGYGPGGDTSFYTVAVRVTWRTKTGPRTIQSIHYLANVRGDTGTPPPLEGGEEP